MQGTLDLNIKNNYHVELIDSTSGRVKQSGDFHNTHLLGFYNLILGKGAYNATESKATGGFWGLGYRVHVGSGTSEPKITDTNLANPMWVDKAASEETYEWIDDYTLRKTASYTFEASLDYVGNVCEIGLRAAFTNKTSNYSNTSATAYCTRSLLTDSEGQVISFNKTDTDILIITITIEISLRSLSDGFYIIRQCEFLEMLLGKLKVESGTSDPNFITYNGYMHLARFDNSIQGTAAIRDRSVGSSIICSSKLSEDEAYLVYPVGRLAATTVTEQTFYKAASIPTLCYWDLTNANVFSPYLITGINLGTGDGTKVSFENPLNYFMAGTDKVYKNGVQLARGVDYTINNMGNKDCLPEVAQMSPIVFVKSDANLTEYTLQVHPLVIPVAHVSGSYSGFKSANEYDTAKESPAFNNTYPLYIEYAEAVTMNCLKCTGGLKTISRPSSYNNLPVGSLFYIDYSVDGEEYIEVGSAATVDANGVFDMTFVDTTAKYWRIRTDRTSYVAMPRNDSYEWHLTLNRKDPYIVFTTPPADGDVLTMDVSMDLIMKNSNYVVDLSCRLDFNI